MEGAGGTMLVEGGRHWLPWRHANKRWGLGGRGDGSGKASWGNLCEGTVIVHQAWRQTFVDRSAVAMVTCHHYVLVPSSPGPCRRQSTRTAPLARPTRFHDPEDSIPHPSTFARMKLACEG